MIPDSLDPALSPLVLLNIHHVAAGQRSWRACTLRSEQV